MTLTDSHYKMLRQTFRLLNLDRFSTDFYDELFRLNPSLRSLFKEDLADQKRKLILILNMVVASLGREQEIVPAVKELGRRHVAYGVKREDYSAVGVALLNTLQTHLENIAEPDVFKSWGDLYAWIIEVATEDLYEATNVG